MSDNGNNGVYRARRRNNNGELPGENWGEVSQRNAAAAQPSEDKVDKLIAMVNGLENQLGAQLAAPRSAPVNSRKQAEAPQDHENAEKLRVLEALVGKIANRINGVAGGAEGELDINIHARGSAGVMASVAPAGEGGGGASAAPLHAILNKYKGDLEAEAAAELFFAKVSAITASGAVKESAVIQKLATCDNELELMVHGTERVVTPTVLWKGGAMVGTAGSTGAMKSRTAITKLARAADDACTKHGHVFKVFQNEVAPGLRAMGTTAGNLRPEEDAEYTVMFVANDLEPAAGWTRSLCGIKQPHYMLPVTCEGVPSGLPVGTGQACNEQVPGARKELVKSRTDGTIKPRWIVADVVPQWHYTTDGRAAIMNEIMTEKRSQNGAANTMANLAGAQADHCRQEQRQKWEQIDSTSMPLSHANY